MLIRILALLISFAIPAKAWPPTFGSEFNFGNAKLKAAWDARGKAVNYTGPRWQVPAEAETSAAKRFSEEVQKKCGEECKVVPHRGKFGHTEYNVEFPDGYSFNISVDPSCVEIQTLPETVAQIREREPRVQKYIFDVARDIGLNDLQFGAHFNIGLASAFDDDAKGFLNFFTNYHNYAELSSGVLGEDFANAPPLSHLLDEQRAKFAELVDEVNQGKITSAKVLIRRLQNEVYTHTPTFEEGFHYQGISVKQINKPNAQGDQPFELRAPRQPKTARERTLLAELMEKRMAWEKEQAAPISFIDTPKNAYSGKELANRFRLYLLDMNEDWEKYKELLPANLQKMPADGFLTASIDWSKPADLKLVKSYIPYLSSSPWVRAHMHDLLNSEAALASGKVPGLVDEIRNGMRKTANAAAQQVGDDFLVGFMSTEPLSAPEKRVVAAQSPMKSLGDRIRKSCERMFGFFAIP